MNKDLHEKMQDRWLSDWAAGRTELRYTYWLETKIAELEAALQAAVDCGMVPTSSARDGGASKYVQQLHVADQIRKALEGEE